MTYTRHHIVPRSRIRKSKRTVLLPEKFHDAWHHVFQNLKPIEAVLFVKEINAMMYSKKIVTSSAIQALIERLKEESK